MAKWKLPEGRKPLTDADMAELTRRLADTAIEQSELYQAAKRDAEEAEAYAAELEAKMKWAVVALEKLSTAQCFGNGEVLGCDLSETPMGREVLARMKYARATIVELKGQDDE